MAQSEGRSADTDTEERSLGELVAQATGNVSDLVRSEIELAKMEIKADALKAAYGSVMFVVAGLAACMVVILMSVSFAYVIVEWLNGWHWLAFLIVALLYVVLAGALIAFGYFRIKKIKGPRRTIRTVRGDLSLLRRRGGSDKTLDASDAPALTD